MQKLEKGNEKDLTPTFFYYNGSGETMKFPGEGKKKRDRVKLWSEGDDGLCED